MTDTKGSIEINGVRLCAVQVGPEVCWLPLGHDGDHDPDAPNPSGDPVGEALRDLAAQLSVKASTLHSLSRSSKRPEEADRLLAKAEGVRLAVSFVEDRLRA